MKYDLIISNPPYGSPGNTITKNIIENVDYDCFVNLLPCNDYRRYNKGFKLYQFVDLNTIRPIMKGFKDAAVTTTLCMVMKERQYSRSQSEFEIENYIDESLKKYFYENARREHYAIDNPNTGRRGIEFIQGRTFIFCDRDMSHGNGFPSGKKSVSYKWNVERSITWSEIVDKYNKPRAREKGKIELHFYGITFNTQAEFDNFNFFMYSEEGSRFMSIITKALNCDGYIHPSKWMPKVDWSRPWTLKQLLLDYNYTPAEIAEILDDLKNYRYMDEAT